MHELKAELQIKYHTITDFSSHVRKLVSPYSSYAKNIGFENVNKPNERVLLRFPDENYIISVDWNHIAVAVSGKTKDLDKYEGKLRFMYDLIEDIRELDTFEGIEFSVFRTWDLLPNIHSDADSFRETFFTESVPSLSNTNDCAIVIDGELTDSNLSFSTTFGPLDYPRDIERHNLSIFERSAFDHNNIDCTEGCLINSTLRSTSTSFDYLEVRKFLEANKRIINSIEE
ncbi:hypothetical protein [Fodinibius halophilus]|uniref:TIGR04255 family protein n=1 Tax=Fodinibius halophilus TaxID=1736908 RepID=A0A6M1TDY9_9BACT|nr:hypothetical protein [Fodinibius halophilus]NGP88984.1 hypothetical protein [Fodinibius halophilus]